MQLLEADLRRLRPELNLYLLHLYHKEIEDGPSHGDKDDEADVPEDWALGIPQEVFHKVLNHL